MNIQTKLIESAVVTSASVHDSQATDGLVQAGDVVMFGDSAYFGQPVREKMEAKQVDTVLVQKGVRGRALNEKEKAENREISGTRAHLPALRRTSPQPGGHPDDEPLLQPQTLRNHPPPQTPSARRLRSGRKTGRGRQNASARRLKPLPTLRETTHFIQLGAGRLPPFSPFPISNASLQKVRFLEVSLSYALSLVFSWNLIFKLFTRKQKIALGTPHELAGSNRFLRGVAC